MTQLIINGTILPELEGEGYKCYPDDLSEELRMASGRLVTEVGHKITTIKAGPYGIMENSYKNTILSALRSGAVLTVLYLPDGGDELQAGTFKCSGKELTPPGFAHSKGNTSYWRGLSFILRAVNSIA